MAAKGATFTACGTDHILASDRRGTFWLYIPANAYQSDEVSLLKEEGQVSRSQVSDLVSQASDARKVIEGDYVLYRIAEAVDRWNTTIYYVVKTPKGNFYSFAPERTLRPGTQSILDDL